MIKNINTTSPNRRAFMSTTDNTKMFYFFPVNDRSKKVRNTLVLEQKQYVKTKSSKKAKAVSNKIVLNGRDIQALQHLLFKKNPMLVD